MSHLLTPYWNPDSAEKQRYQDRHASIRVTIERTFGRWKRRFHVMHAEVLFAFFFPSIRIVIQVHYLWVHFNAQQQIKKLSKQLGWPLFETKNIFSRLLPK